MLNTILNIFFIFMIGTLVITLIVVLYSWFLSGLTEEEQQDVCKRLLEGNDKDIFNV
jgi:uncharacterized membrane protein YqhA